MQETTNYKLKKIELTDSPADITVLNENWDTLDTEVKEHDSSLISHAQSITEINEELESINTELDTKYDKAGGTISGAVSIASGGLDVTGDSTFNDDLNVKGRTVHEDTIRSTKANFLETKVNVSRGTPPGSTLYSYWSVFSKDGYAEVQKQSRLAHIDYSISNTGISSLGLYVNKYVADDVEVPVGLFARWSGETPQVMLTHTPPANSNDKSIATTNWVRALRATASEYGLIKLADESDLLSEADEAALTVSGAYKLADFRRMSTAYALGDTVNCAFKSEYFLECTKAGTTSGGNLDTRNVTFGQVISDGTCQWTVRRHLKSINGQAPDEDGNINVDVDTDNLAKLNASNIFTSETQNLAHNVTKGSTGTTSYRSIRFVDNQGGNNFAANTFSTLLSHVSSNGNVETILYAHKNDTSSNINSYIGIRYPIDGDPYGMAPTPANNAVGNEIITAEWAKDNLAKLNAENVFTENYQYISHGITKGLTGNASSAALLFKDNSDAVEYSKAIFTTLLSRVDSNGNVSSRLYAHRNDTSANINSYVGIEYPIDNDPYATAPTPANTASGNEIITAEWANANLMTLAGTQTVTGAKTFSGTVTLNGTTTVSKTPTANTHIANKKYVDDAIASKGFGAPDYSAGISISAKYGYTYTVPQNGYLVVLMNGKHGGVNFSINNVVNFIIEGAYHLTNSSDGPNVFIDMGNDTVIPVAKNDAIKFLDIDYSKNTQVKFFPCK